MEKLIRCNRVNCIKCGKMLCINNIPLLSSLTDEEARLISQGVSSDAYKKGDVIFAQGQKANKLYIICSGKMKIFKNSLEGKEQILYILSAGDFIGAFNLLKEDEFDFNAVAIEDTQISTLEKVEFDKIVITNPQITLKIFEKAYERIIKAEALVERLSSKSPDAKIAGLLIDLVEDFGHKTENGILLELSISREEMGSYAGITRETMSRKLQLFQELGLIQLEGVKKILIYDVNKLKAMI
ncbi:Crp/Fnr family transcriptional regulator [Fusibacter ferrireducens]|uniref:Crp/Fnr family transcriptional regulator n=1 Tax=Fusibacter ferrireducens TaxID=2785058 RepID=A0ABR9ZV85_9FIRM|nr:Crp/Fnr family transcriptional regulator [Fusibacter ferrireducens]MBF4693514.1 Crp/Fnr family transcriptional regulator [Fusibacter ferrireducens]